jgi:hypothetical protein
MEQGRVRYGERRQLNGCVVPAMFSWTSTQTPSLGRAGPAMAKGDLKCYIRPVPSSEEEYQG